MEKKSKEWIVKHNGRYIGGLGGKREKKKEKHTQISQIYKRTHMKKKTLKKLMKKKWYSSKNKWPHNVKCFNRALNFQDFFF